MKPGKENPGKELYKQMRALSWESLWTVEVPRFNAAAARERTASVAVIRAVGVVFSESGDSSQEPAVKAWLRSLLQDPCEKIRRYAMAAMPKIGAGATEEAELLTLLKTTNVDREKKFLGKALDKIGGSATLETGDSTGLSSQTEQKVRASIARNESPSTILMDGLLENFAGLRIHLRGRAGLEQIVQNEVSEYISQFGKFRLGKVSLGLVEIIPIASFCLNDLFALRCFGTLGLVLGVASSRNDQIEAIATIITSPLSQNIFRCFTHGSIRYRLDFVEKGHQRGAVRLLANRAYSMCPDILNDPRDAPWSIDIHHTATGDLVELRPRLSPDPRFAYRQGDVPAASHPPLAACMARIAEPMENEIIWDPFCGSGLELIERTLKGRVQKVYGTDRSAEAIEITRNNFASAITREVEKNFICCDFRDFEGIEGSEARNVSLIISNPPMGRRVPIPNLQGLIDGLFFVAARVLRPGGRLVFANPLDVESRDPSLKLQFRQTVDFGGFNCRLEKWQKV